jgi:hypothetical protein
MSGDVHGAMGKSLEQQGGVTPQDELDAGRGRSASMIAMLCWSNLMVKITNFENVRPVYPTQLFNTFLHCA